jgi:ABC-type branched-subunit amino acid transport system substrate-binding protein
MRKRGVYLGFLTFMILSLLALPLFACKPAPPAPDTFTIYFWADLSRIYGFVNVPRLLAVQDAVEYVNTELGGIQGRKFKVVWADHLNDLSVGATIYDRWRVNPNFIFMAMCGSQENEAFHFRYEEDEVVVSTCGVSERGVYPAGYVFATTPVYPNQFGLFIDWLVENWDWKGMGRGPRLAFVTYDTPYGRGCLTPKTYAYAKEKGVEVVDTVFVPVIVVDPTTPLTRVKKAGADWIYGNMLYQTLITLGKENLKGKYGLKFGFNVWAVDDALPILGKEAAEGMVGITPYVLWSEVDSPAIKLVRKVTEAKGRRAEDLTATYLLGWMNVFTIYDALNNLVPKLGWEGINGRELRRHLETWGENYDIHGFVRVAYTPEYREPLFSRVVQVQGGKWVAITPYRRAPFLMADELKGAYKEPPTPPVPKRAF